MHQEFFRRGSDGGTIVLFIHGILGTPDHFLPFLPLVPDSWSVYGVLLDGHGKSVSDFSHTSMEKWKAQIYNLVEQLALQYRNIVIVAHSMGTLFAIDASFRFPQQVKMLFLLAVPLVIRVKPAAIANSVKVAFNRVLTRDPIALAAKKAYSIAPNKKFWQYAGWIPRYWELFREARAARKQMGSVCVPCFVFQSQMDELVSAAAFKYLKGNPAVRVAVLKTSKHFYYSQPDQAFLLAAFRGACNSLPPTEK